MVTSKKFFKEIALDQKKKRKREEKNPNINYRILMGYDCIIFP